MERKVILVYAALSLTACVLYTFSSQPGIPALENTLNSLTLFFFVIIVHAVLILPAAMISFANKMKEKHTSYIAQPGYLNGQIVAVLKDDNGMPLPVSWDAKRKCWIDEPELHFAEASFKPVLNGTILSDKELKEAGITT